MSRVLAILKDAPAPQGDDVAELQNRLLELGVLTHSAAVDEELRAKVYGHCTADAVREFQTDRGLKVDGITGPQTWRALDVRETTQPYTVAPDYAAMNLLEAEVLHVAWAEFAKKVREVPFGSNRGPAVDRYLQWFDPPRPGHRGSELYFVDPHDPERGCKWCGLFGAACVEWASKRLRRPDPGCLRCHGGGKIPPGGSTDCECLGWNPIRKWGTGSLCSEWYRLAKRDGCLADEPAPGTVVLLGDPPNPRHLTLCAWVNIDRNCFGTVEGNSDNGVRSRVRQLNEVGAVIRLPFPPNWTPAKADGPPPTETLAGTLNR